MRRSGRTAALAWALAALSLMCATATITLDAVNAPAIHSPEDATLLEIVIATTFALAGGVIAWRVPRNPTGWLLLSIGLVEGIAAVAAQLSVLNFVTHPGTLPVATWFLWLYSWVSALVYPTGLAALTFLVIPIGRLPSRRWRPLVVVLLFFSATLALSSMLAPGPLSVGLTNVPDVGNPTGVEALRPLLASNQSTPGVTGVLYTIGLALALISASAPLVRVRRARGEEREQVKWIAYTIVVTTAINLVVVLLTLVDYQAFQSQLLWLIPIGVGYGILLPVSIGIAVFKYRLYDIDIIINRTLVYGTLAVFITAVYVGIAVGIGALVGSGGKPNLGLSILATAIVAIGFQPLRSRLQKLANRLVYGKRATPYEALSAFSSRVADSYASHDLLQRMTQVLGDATGAELAEVWLKSGGELRRATAYPQADLDRPPIPIANGELRIDGTGVVVPVRHQDELLGALTVTKRRNEQLTPMERRLIEDLAHQAGLVLKNVGLTAALEARLDELRASRQRLVTAQDEARRRLERNLHDGAQQNLVALKVKLGLVGMLVAKDPEKAKATVQELQADADEALQTLRDLARGIYPPLLADQGLRAALESQARKATLPVVVDADGATRYPQEIEAAVYFCCLEALQNAQKYGNATQVTVRLRENDHSLSVDVEDDGDGFDAGATRAGSGLTNMKDRIDALGGTFDVESSVGHGTRVHAQLPAPRTLAE